MKRKYSNKYAGKERQQENKQNTEKENKQRNDGVLPLALAAAMMISCIGNYGNYGKGQK